MEKITLPIKGMHCASCASVIQRMLKKSPGVAFCDVNFGTETAALEFDPKETSLNNLSEKIRPLGYDFILPDNQHPHVMPDGSLMSGMDHSQHLGLGQSKQEKLKELTRLKDKLDFVLPISGLVFLLMMWEIAGRFYSLPALPIPMDLYNKILLLLAAPVLFWVGRPYLRGL